MSKGSARLSRVFALVAAAAALVVPAAFAGDSADTAEWLGDAPAVAGDGLTADTTNRWLVELNGSAADFRKAAKAAGLKYSERFAFSTLWNGVSLSVSGSELDRLRTIAGVKAIYPVLTAQLDPQTGGEEIDLAYATQTTGAAAANAAGHTGAGVLVAIMDTGVDWNHPDLGGCFGAGCKVVKGWDFVGDAYDANSANVTYNPVPSPDPNPDDCNGHGTHVAGIAAANGSVKGVAPGASIAAYRVFGCEGSTDSDIMIAAMERALADGAHVLNMSIGAAFQTWPQYPTAVAASKLVDRGVVVVTSIGNSGANGVYSAGAPGVGDKVIGTASFDNTNVTQFAFAISPDGKLNGYVNSTAAPVAPKSGSLPMARTGTQTSTADGCGPATTDIAVLPPLTGQAVLIRRGFCGFYNKALAAQRAGAAAVVLYNNVAGGINPTVAPVAPNTETITIPVVAISAADGNVIDSRLAAGSVTLTWTDQTITTPSGTANLISSFSSYGMNAELTLKPDIAAPGGNIWSTYPLEKAGFANVGGTSMASPHVAGAAALLRAAKPMLPATSFRDVLQNSADPKVWSGNPGLGFLDMTFRQGAGMVDVDDAIAATTLVTPGKLSLGESEAGPQTRTLTIRNNGSAAATYTLGHAPALAANGTPFVVSFFNAPAGVAFSSPTVTVPAGGTGTVDVTVTANSALADRSQYGGYITLTSGADTFRVPYAGLKGDYQSIQHIGFGLLGRVAANGSLVVLPTGGSTFTLVGNDVPNVFLNMTHQARRLELSLLDATTGLPVHDTFSRFVEQDYLGRSSTANTVSVYPWNGTRLHSEGKGSKAGLTWKQVPDGSYKIVARALKALGDPANPAHWETWTSDAITIDRP